MSGPRLPLVCVIGLVAAIFSRAAPPGATVNQKVANNQSVTLPPGFQLSTWAQLGGARFLAVAANGDVFVSQPSSGQVSILRPDPNGGNPAIFTWVSGLNGPQGLAFSTVNGVTWLYVGEDDQIDRYVYQTGDTSARAARQVLVTNLLGNDAHPYKDIAIGPDQTVYFGYGSSANINPADVTTVPALAAVYKMNPDGSGLQMLASGLRNPEGLAFLPGTSMLWAAVNNRDDVPYPFRDSTGLYGKVVTSYVDNHPPDLFTNVVQGGNYGWPFCNSDPDTPSGYNSPPFDNDYDTNADGHVDCATMTRVTKGLQAHSAPLGLAFLQGTKFAPPYRNGAIIAYHGSWDRTVPTGYKVVYFPWDSLYQTPGDAIDFITGFSGWGRPVAIAVNLDGSLLITDDLAGAIYKLVWTPSAVSAANGYPIVAPNSYAAVYGSGFPTGSASLTITDSTGAAFQVSPLYASASQTNFIVPNGVAPGPAKLTLNAGNNTHDLGAPQIAAVAPGLFSLSGDGTGVAAATAVDSRQSPVRVFICASAPCQATPIDVAGNPVYLSLYGTGIRGAAAGTVQVLLNGVSVPVLYTGAQCTDPGLDQINFALPGSLAGTGEVEVQVAIGAVTSNVVTIQVQ